MPMKRLPESGVSERGRHRKHAVLERFKEGMRVGSIKYICGILLAAVAGPLGAQSHPPGSDAELAEKLSNPVAAMISLPFQFNYEQGIGPVDDGDKTYMNFQPVIPVHLNPDWNMIMRFIVPVVDQHDVFPGAG